MKCGDMENIFNEIDKHRAGGTEQHYRQDISPVYENDYIKLLRIDSSNKSGGAKVICGKQWSIIFDLKKSFITLSGWRNLKERYGDDVNITPVRTGVLKGCYGIRFYHMSSNPTDKIITDILDYIFGIRVTK